MDEPGRYQHDFVEGGSYRAAVELVARSGRHDGLVIDLGCGFGAVAGPLRDLGLTYVGTDLDGDGLRDLEQRGFETHVVDLRLPRDALLARLHEVAAGRAVRHLLALDVLEHLPDPGGAAATLAAFAAEHPTAEADLVVSYPNVTHLDVAAKLLVGRWDRSDEGLLDRTHLQFFTEGDLVELFADAGWDVVDAADVVSEHSDQSFPDESPVLRPDTPLRDLLRAVRRRAEPNGATYQFVRRYTRRDDPRPEPANAVPPAARFATVFLLSPDETIESDLAEQSSIDFDIVTIGAGDDLGAAMRAAAGRYVVVVTGGERLGPGWMDAFFERAESADTSGSSGASGASDADAVRGRVLRAEVGEVDPAALADTPSAQLPTLLASATPLAGESFDPLAADPPGAVVPAAFAVPTELVRTTGLRPDPADGRAAITVFLARCVQLAGLVAVPERVVLTAGTTEPGLLGDGVVEALGRDPYLLPVGSAERLLSRRELATTARETEERLQIALAGALDHARGVAAARDERVDALLGQLHRLEAERDDLRATVARLRGERRRRWFILKRRRPRRPER